MFEMAKMLGRLSEVKDRVKAIKAELATHEIPYEDPENGIQIVMSGNKDVRAIHLGEHARAMAPQDQERALVKALNAATDQSRSYAKEALQKRLNEEFPSVAGLDLSKYLD